MYGAKVRRILETTLEMRPDSLGGAERLRDLDGWDSMATLSFIIGIDKELGITLSGSLVTQCRTVADLIALVDQSGAERAA